MHDEMPEIDAAAPPRVGARVGTVSGQVYSITESIDIARAQYDEAEEDSLLEYHVILYTRSSWEVVRWYPHKRAIWGFLEMNDSIQEKAEEDRKAEEEERAAASPFGPGVQLIDLGFFGGGGNRGGGS